jgi:hypothetical protein
MNLPSVVPRVLFVCALCWAPVSALAAPVVLVDAIPSGASFVSEVEVRVPIADLSKADPKEVEAGLASAISSAASFAEANGANYICLLSAPGDDALGFRVEAADGTLRLRSTNASFVVVFYQGGDAPPAGFSYSTEKPEIPDDRVRVSIKKVAVPDGWTTAGWIYFNLPRFQLAASKAGATRIFLASSGQGEAFPFVVPGLKEPLMVFPERTELSVIWYPGKNKAANLAGGPSELPR